MRSVGGRRSLQITMKDNEPVGASAGTGPVSPLQTDDRPTPRPGLRDYLELVKFSHTVFALPFALSSMLIAANGLPEARIVLWIMVAMVTARTAAMGFNRIVDRHIAAVTPRTAGRGRPAGQGPAA